MAKEIQIIGWCDGPHETRVRSTIERTVALDGQRPIALDLCQDHNAAFSAVEELLEFGEPVAVDSVQRRGVGRPPKSGRPASGGQAHPMVASECQFPGCNKGPHGGPFIAQSRTGLGAHMTRSHKIGLGEFERAKPSTDTEPVVN